MRLSGFDSNIKYRNGPENVEAERSCEGIPNEDLQNYCIDINNNPSQSMWKKRISLNV